MQLIRWIFSNGFKYTTIDDEKAIGICGSGLVDAIAGMLSSGIIDETGRLLNKEELHEIEAEAYGDRLIDFDGEHAFLIAAQDEAATDIVITQKDIRELQIAKSAVAAGIKTLIKNAGIHICDIKKVYLAGGFGNYINIDSALRIGLLPKALKSKDHSSRQCGGSRCDRSTSVMQNDRAGQSDR